jgi:hypothetical protein
MPQRVSPRRCRAAVGCPRRAPMTIRLPRASLAVAVVAATAGGCAAPALAAPAPHRGRTVIIARVSGTVRISQPHRHPVTVHRPIALRSGGTLFTTGGVAAVTVSSLRGEKTAQVSHGDSRVTQRADGETTFTLAGLACSSDAISNSRRSPTDTLWVHDHHGPFISRGGYASGAARGTEWTTTDTCDSTTIHVRLGKVLVTDFVRSRHVLVSAGHSYTARSGVNRALSWSAPQPIGNGGALTSISCPTTSFCAAVNANADVLTTTDPAGGPDAWKTTPVGTSSLGFDAISCPTTTLCVASEAGTGNVYVSTDPSGGTWSVTNLVSPDGDGLAGVTCPTTTLCVAADIDGDVLTTTDPASGNWSTDPVYPVGSFDTVACAGAGLCIAVGSGLSTSTNPAGGTGAWQTTTSLGAGSATCPTTSLCLLGDGTDDIYASTDPSGGPSTYHEQQTVDSHSVFATITSIACPSAGDCLAVDDAGDVISTNDPTAGPWTTAQPDSTGSLNAIACPSTMLCVAVDGAGNAIVGTPAGRSTSGTDVIARAPHTPLRATATAATTRVVVMAGFTVGGMPTMRITQTVRGSCFSTSDAALRDDAYRCTSGNELFDPCLAPPASVRAGHVVVCPTDPFRHTGIEIRLTRALPRNHGPAPSERGIPFALRLTNGCEAMLDTGATAVIGRERANYYCARTHQALWGAPSRRGRLWTIWSASPNAKRLSRRVSIAEAWF